MFNIMVPLDRCILWLTLISLSQFHQLPAPLINPSNQNPGQIVSRVSSQGFVYLLASSLA